METGYRLKTSGDKTASATFPMVSLSVVTTGWSLQCVPSCPLSSEWGEVAGNVVDGCCSDVTLTSRLR